MARTAELQIPHPLLLTTTMATMRRLGGALRMPHDAQTRSALSFTLPDELVAAVLEFLPLRDLRRAAVVSRTFYAAAWASGLYFHRRLGDSTDTAVVDQLLSYGTLLQHALTKELRLSVRLDWLKYDDAGEELKLKAAELMRLVSDSMPVLVSLSIKAPPSLFPEIWAALRHPAPRLRCFQLECTTANSTEIISTSNDLFSGTAPRLCELRLTGVALGADPLAMFVNVVRLSISYGDDLPHLATSSFFPRLSELILVCESFDREVPPRSIDLRGITLQKLVFRETKENAQHVSFARYFNGSEIPDFQHIRLDATGMDWNEPLGWKADTGELNINISSRFVATNIVVAPSDLSRRCTYSIKALDIREHPLALLPGISARLAYLRLDSVDVPFFLETRAQYSALTRVRIDVLYRDGGKAGSGLAFVSHDRMMDQEHRSGVVRVRCPVLRTLALHAAPVLGLASLPRGPKFGYTPASVEADDVAFVCRALGPSAKLVLELGGVSVENRMPDKERLPKHAFLQGTPFQRAVANVRYVKFPDKASCAVFGEKDWLDDPALLEDNYLPRSIPRLDALPMLLFDGL